MQNTRLIQVALTILPAQYALPREGTKSVGRFPKAQHCCNELSQNYMSQAGLQIRTCPQRDDIVGQEGNCDGTAYDFLYVSSNDCNLHAKPHQVAWQLRIFLPTVLGQVEPGCNAKSRRQALKCKALQHWALELAAAYVQQQAVRKSQLVSRLLHALMLCCNTLQA